MTEEPGGTHRRRRRRATSAAGAPATREAPLPGPDAAPGAVPPHPPVPDPAPATSQQPGTEAAEATPSRRRPQPARDAAERGLRDLVGSGRSQLGVSGALRGRDVNRPTEEDLAEAEENVVIVRRNWQPADKR